MLKVEIKKGENIEVAIKRLRRKVNSTQQNKRLREREEFKKPSVKKREEKLKAIYIEKKYGNS